MSNINNPPNPSASLTVSITTRDAANTPIDGPTPTTAYNMVQVGNAQIAPGAITTTKIATGAVTTGDIAKSLGYERTLNDGESGLTPDSSETIFVIIDPLITSPDQNAIINLDTPSLGGPVCGVTVIGHPTVDLEISCSSPPLDGTILSYAVLNLPLA
jgi:hypothetical protein